MPEAGEPDSDCGRWCGCLVVPTLTKTVRTPALVAEGDNKALLRLFEKLGALHGARVLEVGTLWMVEQAGRK